MTKYLKYLLAAAFLALAVTPAAKAKADPTPIIIDVADPTPIIID